MGIEKESAQVSKATIRSLLDKVCGYAKNFKPKWEFYAVTGINHRRWAKLYRGELSITLDELRNLCKYLKIEFNAETFNRQLKMFNNDSKN